MSLSRTDVFWLETAFRRLTRPQHVLVLLFVADQGVDGCRVDDVAREFLGVSRSRVIEVLEVLVESRWLDNRSDVVSLGEQVRGRWAQLLAVLGRWPMPAPAISWPLLAPELEVLSWELEGLQLEAAENPEGARPGDFTQVAALFKVLLGDGDGVELLMKGQGADFSDADAAALVTAALRAWAA